jgi:hypothetical protein
MTSSTMFRDTLLELQSLVRTAEAAIELSPEEDYAYNRGYASALQDVVAACTRVYERNIRERS